jgi:probable HAF family extracellular repeat protein
MQKSLLCLCIAAEVVGTAQAGPHAYVITEFKGLTGHPYPGISDLNNLSGAVGKLDAQPQSAAYWSSATTPRLLANSGADSSAEGINDSGDVCGWGPGPREGRYALYWQGASQQQALPDLFRQPDAGYSQCNRLNNSGVKVGKSRIADGHNHAVMWDSGNSIHDLGTLKGGDSEATGISPSGLIVGSSFASTTGDITYNHAVLWQNGAFSDLGTLPGGLGSAAAEVNDSGDIVGQSDVSVGTLNYPAATHAVLWRSEAPIDLGVAPNYSRSSALSVNASGTIAGFVFNDPQTLLWDAHAVLWDQGQLVDLTVLLQSQVPAKTYLLEAVKINDKGEVVLYALNQTALTTHYYLARPVGPTHVSLRSSENPAYIGDPINFVASVTADSGGIPRAPVTLKDGNTILQVASPDPTGIVRFRPISNLSVGTHRITASFTGYGVFASSVSPGLSESIRFKLVPLRPPAR